jgi:hypothetical protein
MHNDHSLPPNGSGDEDSFQILAECPDGYIGVCLCCREFNYSYKNILLTFQEGEMREFFDWLIACRKKGSLELPLPNGRKHVYRSPLYNLFMVYTEDELDEIERLYSEVRLMLETMQILTP